MDSFSEHAAWEVIRDTLEDNPAVRFSLGEGMGFYFRRSELARYLVRFAKRRNGLYVNTDGTGVVLFYPVTSKRKSFADVWDELRLLVCAIGPWRALRVFRRKRKIEQHHQTFEHYLHCWYLGVSPKHRSLARAAELRDVLFRAADELQWPVLAETTMMRNRTAYERMGFRVYAEVEVAGMITYLLCRDPSKRNSRISP